MLFLENQRRQAKNGRNRQTGAPTRWRVVIYHCLGPLRTFFLLLPLFFVVLYLLSVRQVVGDACPLVPDLNRNQHIDVRGISTASAQVYAPAFLPAFVEFDLLGSGEPQKIDWLQDNTDGLLLDVRRGTPPADINGTWLFANDKYRNGFEKLREFDSNGDLQISGEELAGIAIWKDNGDAKFSPDGLGSLEDYNIISLSTTYRPNNGKYGGEVIADEAGVSDGVSMYMEHVWFLSEQTLYPQDRAFASVFYWFRI